MSMFKLVRLIHIFGAQIFGINNYNEWKPHTYIFREIMLVINELEQHLSSNQADFHMCSVNRYLSYTCNEWKPHTDKYREIKNDEN